MKKINTIILTIFYLLNIVFIFLYLYPGSIFGYLLHRNLNLQPQITKDFLVSSNHFYAFFLLSFLGIIIYRKSKKFKFLTSYLLFLSFFLEFMHFVIPNRSFELADLFGNTIGVLSIIIVYKFLKKYEN
tara:strand:+ start:1947 stop:2333 length:387 start_codon:yes stop_codon:yes gene_type:complete